MQNFLHFHQFLFGARYGSSLECWEFFSFSALNLKLFYNEEISEMIGWLMLLHDQKLQCIS